MSKPWNVSITWLGHATVLYRASSGTTVLVDAWIDQNPACPERAKKLPHLDVMLITHGHSDHFADAVAIAKKHGCDVISNFEISLYLEGKKVERVHGINKGGSLALHDIRVTMTHAVHSSTIQEGARIIPAGEACGFVIEFPGGTRVYHAGDTAVFGDMKLIGELYKPSIAVLPIGDLYTMSPLEAAMAARLVGARFVIPVHHGTFPALTGTPAELARRLQDRPDIEVIALEPGATASATERSAVA